MFAGSNDNTVIIEGDGSNSPELKNSKVTSTNVLYSSEMNGGLFYLKGIT